MTRLFSLPILAVFAVAGTLALTAAPHVAHAQDDSGATAPGDGGDGGIDYGVGPEPGNYGGAGSAGTAGDSIYGGGPQVLDPSTPEGRAAQLAEIKKKHDAMVKRMKANGDKMIQEAKERAWKIAHPGQPYDSTANDTNADGTDDGTGGGDASGDMSGGDPSMDAGGDDTGGGDDGSGADDTGGGDVIGGQ